MGGLANLAASALLSVLQTHRKLPFNPISMSHPLRGYILQQSHYVT